MTVAGFLGGVIAPSRDMLVRAAAPPGAAGRAFGIVSTGFNFSGILAPLLYGFIMDQHMPHWVFGASVAFMLMTVLLALVTDRKGKGRRSRGPESARSGLMYPSNRQQRRSGSSRTGGSLPQCISAAARSRPVRARRRARRRR